MKMSRTGSAGNSFDAFRSVLRRNFLMLAVVGIIGIAGCGAGSDRMSERDGASARVPAVEALPARAGTLPLFEELSGGVRSRNQVSIRPEISASVVEVMVRNGDTVVRGQPLVRLDGVTQEDRLRQAEAELQMAEATAAAAEAREAEVTAQVVRTRVLADRGLVSVLDLETREAQLAAVKAEAMQALARVAQMRASAAESRSELARTVVRAPAAGRVGQRAVEVGMVVNPSTTLFLLGDFEDLLVEVPLTQDLLRHVEVSTPVEVAARDLEGAPIRAEVSRISPFIEQGSFSTIAEIDLPTASGLRPGMFVAVRVLRGESEAATLVPTSAVWEAPTTGFTQVFVVEEDDGLAEPPTPESNIPDRARRVAVRRVQVLAEGQGQTGAGGVADGEWVVTLGQHVLFEQLQTEAADTTLARVRATSWPQVLELQSLQREDLLKGFLKKQRRVAEILGAELPTDGSAVDELLATREESIGDPPPSPAGEN